MRASAGLSLVEALSVLALLVVLLAVAVPHLPPSPELSARAVARQLVADLYLSQRLSIARGEDYELAFATPPPYQAYTVRNARTQVPEPDFPKQVPSEVQVTGPSGVYYTPPEGMVRLLGVGPITVRGGTQTVLIEVLEPSGYVRVTPP